MYFVVVAVIALINAEKEKKKKKIREMLHIIVHRKMLNNGLLIRYTNQIEHIFTKRNKLNK